MGGEALFVILVILRDVRVALDGLGNLESWLDWRSWTGGVEEEGDCRATGELWNRAAGVR
jgi:hypothetical protein